MDENLRIQAEILAKRPYSYKVSEDETTEGRRVFLARVIELPDCVGQGNTAEEAFADVRSAAVDYIASMLEDGLPVPTPIRLLPVSDSRGVFDVHVLLHSANANRVKTPRRRDALADTAVPDYISLVAGSA
jgi:predicted RNase H-like HicB family nuclease